MKKSTVLLLHIGYWFLYLLLISTFVLILPQAMAGRSFARLSRMLFFSPLTLLFLLPCVLSFYIFYTVLFTEFLQRKKILVLVVLGLVVCVGIGESSLFVSQLFFSNPSTAKMPWADKLAMLLFISLLCLVHGTIAIVIKGFINWYADIKVKEALNKKNYEMELALVKSQLNPHFLFNTINNIDVLIEIDATKASLYLNKLSEMMRFMLYETKTETVPLAKELDYVEKYIALQKIRTSNENYINYTLDGKADNIFIAPMIFIPFLENAFKYAENKRLDNAIVVKILIEQKKIIFSCSNKYQPNNTENLQSGLGNELIQKRLDLLYPQQHDLQITKTSELYSVILILYNGH